MEWFETQRDTVITASRLTKELTGGIKIEQRCVGSDLPLAGGKAKIPERYQEQMCGCIETLTDAIHNRCYQRQEITHREESSDSEGTMCYANGSSKWHTPAYYPLIYFKTYI